MDTRGLGTLAKLPLELRIRIWLTWAYEEHPWRTYARLKPTSHGIKQECSRILLTERILTFDLLSHGRARWPSEFLLHDQFGKRWPVCPQLRGPPCTLEEGDSLSVFTDHMIQFKQVRIILVAPQDAGEALLV